MKEVFLKEERRETVRYGERNKPRYGWKKEGREKRCETDEDERAGCKNLSKVSRQEGENAGLTWIFRKKKSKRE